MIVDAARWPSGAVQECDVCVVGSGPAGISLALALRGSGLRVLVLESGGLLPDARAQKLNRATNTGQPYWRLDSSRHRMFGGSGNRWGGVCRPLDAADLEPRSWVDGSGWPITAADLAPWWSPAASALGLPSADFDLETFSERIPSAFPLQGSEFETVLFQSSPHKDYGGEFEQVVRAAQDVTLALNATVTDLRLEPGTSRIDRVEVALPDGRRREVRAAVVVLASGAVENARTLLAARQDREHGLGNEHGLVGRYFMEHPHVPLGHLAPRGATLDRDLYERTRYGDVVLRGALAPTARAQRDQELLSCTISVEPPTYTYGSPFIGWSPLVTLPAQRAFLALHRRQRSTASTEVVVDSAAGGAKASAKRAWYAARSVPARQALRASRRTGATLGVDTDRLYSLYVRSEQVPDPSSRVTLTDERDDLGVPRASLHWKVGEQDLASMQRWVDLLDVAVAARGLGRVIPASTGWDRNIIGGPHHIGTTRMSASASSGVVDAQCRVHSVDNLYVAGSSVFTTGGHANPTFTLVALALRLAAHLRATRG